MPVFELDLVSIVFEEPEIDAMGSWFGSLGGVMRPKRAAQLSQ
jgi:hypothetical protein